MAPCYRPKPVLSCVRRRKRFPGNNVRTCPWGPILFLSISLKYRSSFGSTFYGFQQSLRGPLEGEWDVFSGAKSRTSQSAYRPDVKNPLSLLRKRSNLFTVQANRCIIGTYWAIWLACDIKLCICFPSHLSSPVCTPEHERERN